MTATRIVLAALALLSLCGLVMLAQSTVQAWDCANYNFHVTREGTVSVANNSASDEPAQNATVYINGANAGVFAVPALSAGASAVLGTVSTPGAAGFTWSVDGDQDCEDSGSYDPQATSTLEPTATAEPSATPTATNTPEPTATVTNTPTATLTEPPPSATSTGTLELTATDSPPVSTDLPLPTLTATTAPLTEPRVSVGLARSYPGALLGTVTMGGQWFALYAGGDYDHDGALDVPAVGVAVYQGHLRLHRIQQDHWIFLTGGQVLEIEYLDGHTERWKLVSLSYRSYADALTPARTIGSCYANGTAWAGVEAYTLERVP